VIYYLYISDELHMQPKDSSTCECSDEHCEGGAFLSVEEEKCGVVKEEGHIEYQKWHSLQSSVSAIWHKLE